MFPDRLENVSSKARSLSFATIFCEKLVLLGGAHASKHSIWKCGTTPPPPPPPLVAREQSNSIKWKRSSVTTITDAMQKKHDVLQVTVLGNCKLEYSTEGILPKMSLNIDIRYYVPGFVSWALRTFLLTLCTWNSYRASVSIIHWTPV